MTQQFEMVTTTVVSPVKENRLATLKGYLATEEQSADRSQLYVDDLKDSIKILEAK
jgi:TfoX/Sxy family transcriptional regulator of competence genes